MASPDKSALSRQINADPRVQQYIAQRRRGSVPVELDAATLKQFGYTVPADWNFRSSGGRGSQAGQLYDGHDHWDTGIGIAAGALGGTAALGMAGVGPLAGGGGGAVNAAGAYTTPAYAAAGAPIAPLGSAAVGGGSIVNTLKQALTNPKTYASLAPILAQMASGGFGRGSGGGIDDGFIKQAYADAQRNNAMKEARYRRVDPLHQAVTQLAWNQLPDYARTGISPNNVQLPED
jgi:hypothetical protein